MIKKESIEKSESWQKLWFVSAECGSNHSSSLALPVLNMGFDAAWRSEYMLSCTLQRVITSRSVGWKGNYIRHTWLWRHSQVKLRTWQPTGGLRGCTLAFSCIFEIFWNRYGRNMWWCKVMMHSKILVCDNALLTFKFLPRYISR